MASAERLRDTVADVPRVLVDPLLLRAVEHEPMLRASHHSVPEELGYLRRILRMDQDALWFVDYLKDAMSGMEEEPAAISLLGGHAAMIRRGLARCTTLDPPSRRWMWLTGYHNRVVREHAERTRKEVPRDLLVPMAGPLFYGFPGSIEPQEQATGGPKQSPDV